VERWSGGAVERWSGGDYTSSRVIGDILIFFMNFKTSHFEQHGYIGCRVPGAGCRVKFRAASSRHGEMPSAGCPRHLLYEQPLPPPDPLMPKAL